MPIPIQCGACGSALHVKDHLAGRRIQCPKCKGPISVPAASAVPPLPSERTAVEVPPLPGAERSGAAPSRNSLLIGAGGAVLLVAVITGAFLLGKQNGPPRPDVAAITPVAAPPPSIPATTETSEAEKPSDPAVAMRPAPTPPPLEKVATSPSPPSDDPPSPKPDSAVQTPPTATAPAEKNTPPEVAAPAPLSTEIVFEPVPLAEPATSFAMTEDGRFLVVTHQTANQVSVYDIAEGRVVQTVEIEAPRAVLCRGGQAFVASAGKGIVSVLSEEKGWRLANELQVDHPNVIFLSAAGGRNFKDELLVTCHGEGKQGSYQGPKVFHLDVRRDKCRLLGAHALASVSQDGKLVFVQKSFNLSPSGGISAFPYAGFTSKAGKPIFEGGIQQTPFVYQVQPGGYWLADNMVFGGVPISQVQKDVGGLLIGDLAQKVVYAVSENQLTAHSLNVGFDELGKRKVEWPAKLKNEFERIGHRLYRQRDYILDFPVAFTRPGALTMVVIDMKEGVLYSARTAPFVVPSATPGTTPLTANGKPSDEPAAPDDPQRAAAAAVTGTLPRLVVEGRPLTHQLSRQPETKYELMSGPDGLSISGDGKVSWTPTAEQVGVHELKIRVGRGRTESFERPSIEVVDRALADSVGGDLAKIDTGDRIELDVDHLAITRGADGKSLLLLQGDTLRVLGPDGITIERQHTLPGRYDDIEDRENVFVALTKSPPALDLFDKRTLKRVEHHPLEVRDRRVLDVMDFAIHPKQPLSYIAIKHDVELPRFTVVVVNERTGKIDVPGILGTYVEIDPQGRYLYTGYKDLYDKGVKFHVNPDWRLIETPQYGNVDMLIAWDLRRGTPKVKQVVREAGGNGSGIRLSPDGERLTYLSHVGYPLHSGNLAGFGTKDFDAAPVRYETKDRGVTSELAYHPTLPWAASPGGGSAVLFHRETGAVLERKLLVTRQGVGADPVDRLYFSPDGRSLILQCRGGDSGRYLRRVGLKLDGSELARAKAPIAVPRGEPAAAKPKIAVTEFDALKAAATSGELTPKEIGQRYMDSVVVVRGEGTSGTGFVIGKKGYVLTCAHVLPDSGETEVAYSGGGGKGGAERSELVTAAAKVVYVDEDRDIALLKFEPAGALTPVRLHAGSPVESGEAITVIGNPGLGAAVVLTHTLTSGVVSNPDRELDGQHYIQTSAAVNPGNSGGPMFDSRGNVVGLVSLKGKIEGAGFAVPAGVLRDFLKELSGAPGTP